MLVWKNTSVIVKRVPSVRPTAVSSSAGSTAQKTVVYVPPPQGGNTSHQSRAPPRRLYPGQGYPQHPPAAPAAAGGGGGEGDAGVDSSIAALVSGASQAWETEKAVAYAAGRGRGRGGGRFGGGGGGRFGGGRGDGGGRGGVGEHQSGPPPPGYVCFRCSVPGHWIAQCPTNADPNFDVIRMKNAYGIPQNRLEHVADGVLVAPTGESSNLMAAEDEFSSMMGFLVDREKKNDTKDLGAPPELPAPGGAEAPVAALPAPEEEKREDNAVQITLASNADGAALDESDALEVNPTPAADEPVVSVDLDDGDDLDLGPDPSDDLGPEPAADDDAATADRPDGEAGKIQGVFAFRWTLKRTCEFTRAFFFFFFFSRVSPTSGRRRRYFFCDPTFLFSRFTPNCTIFVPRPCKSFFSHHEMPRSSKRPAPPRRAVRSHCQRDKKKTYVDGHPPVQKNNKPPRR